MRPNVATDTSTSSMLGLYGNNRCDKAGINVWQKSYFSQRTAELWSGQNINLTLHCSLKTTHMHLFKFRNTDAYVNRFFQEPFRLPGIQKPENWETDWTSVTTLVM
jgi:hypothetical protein